MSLTQNQALFYVLTSTLEEWAVYPDNQLDCDYVDSLLGMNEKEARAVAEKILPKIGHPGEISTIVIPLVIDILRQCEAELRLEEALDTVITSIVEAQGDEPRSV